MSFNAYVVPHHMATALLFNMQVVSIQRNKHSSRDPSIAGKAVTLAAQRAALQRATRLQYRLLENGDRDARSSTYDRRRMDRLEC
jgi:hypothetical protein